MGFFATFWTWLNGQMAGFIGDNTARLAAALEPALITLSTIYVMAWGYLQLTGKIEEPLLTGIRRILVLALILGVSLRLWLYNTVIVDTFYTAPAKLAAAVLGGTDPVGTIDVIWERGGAVAGTLWAKPGILRGDWGFYLAGAVVWCLIGALCVYAMFLIALSNIALSVLLALGPLFIGLTLFDATRRFFAAWLAQLANYALVTVLTTMIAALLLQVVQSYATQTAARGSSILTVDALNMVLIAVLVFLVLRQVMPIAAGLASGVSLNSFSLASRSLGWGMRKSGAGARAALALALPYSEYRVRGAFRKTGEMARSAAGRAAAGAEALGRGWRNARR